MINIYIATPESNIYEGEVKSITIPTSSGVITVLRGHEPLITTVVAGELFLKNVEDNNKSFSIYNAVVHIENVKSKTNVKVLAESMEDVSDLDIETIEKSLERAKLANKEKVDDSLSLDTGVLRDMNRLKLARKYKL